MQRTLTPGPRFLVVLAVIFGPLLALAVSVGVRNGQWGETAKVAVFVVVLCAAVAAGVYGRRIVVTAESISFHDALGRTKRARFSEIRESVASALADRGHPLDLLIYCHGRREPALVLPLKALRRADVTWLLALPELRLRAITTPLGKLAR
jgi:hypothetical protein